MSFKIVPAVKTTKFLYNIKELLYFNFNKIYSLKYYNDIYFRNFIFNYINTSKQLSLKLNYCHEITDVFVLNNIHTLDLSFCNNINDISALKNVHTLYLRSCENITDISALSNVHTLELDRCNNITDVSVFDKRKSINQLRLSS